MKDFGFKRFERHRTGGTPDQMVFSYPAPVTASGKTYQYSPNPDVAPRLFLIGDAPQDRTIDPTFQGYIQREPGRGQTVCPYSGYIGPDDEFVHFDDIAAIKSRSWRMLRLTFKINLPVWRKTSTAEVTDTL